MSKIWEKVKDNVPTSIPENEKHLYHVVIVEGRFNRHTLETTFKVKSQSYNGRSWRTVKDRLKRLGYTNVHLIHDPTQAEVKEETTTEETGTNEGGGKGNNSDNANDKAKEARDRRKALIARAKELGYEGALNAKNEIFEKFIEDALRQLEENNDEE